MPASAIVITTIFLKPAKITVNANGILILNRIYNFEESDKVEYDGLIDWSTSKCGRHHTLKNHEKTRILYPYIYERIKNKDISVRYK